MQEAQQAYSEAKGPLPWAQKVRLLHGDVAKAEEGLAKAEEALEAAAASWHQAEERREQARERLKRQKARLEEYTGDGKEEWGDAQEHSEELEFAKGTLASMDECGRELMDLSTHIQSGAVDQDLVQQSLDFLLSRVGGVRDKAFELEEKANWQEEEEGEWNEWHSDGGEGDDDPITVDEMPKESGAGPGGEATPAVAAEDGGKKKKTEDEGMPQAVGENDPNKKQKHSK